MYLWPWDGAWKGGTCPPAAQRRGTTRDLVCCASTDVFGVDFWVKPFEIALATVAGSGSWVCVRHTGKVTNVEESGSWVCVCVCVGPLGPPSTGSPLPHRRPGELRFPQLSLATSGSAAPNDHVRSFRMTVARMRKKVFQPRVTAKPRHTINWDRPQPAQNTGPLAWKHFTRFSVLFSTLNLHFFNQIHYCSTHLLDVWAYLTFINHWAFIWLWKPGKTPVGLWAFFKCPSSELNEALVNEPPR